MSRLVAGVWRIQFTVEAGEEIDRYPYTPTKHLSQRWGKVARAQSSGWWAVALLGKMRTATQRLPGMPKMGDDDTRLPRSCLVLLRLTTCIDKREGVED